MTDREQIPSGIGDPPRDEYPSPMAQHLIDALSNLPTLKDLYDFAGESDRELMRQFFDVGFSTGQVDEMRKAYDTIQEARRNA